MNTQFENTFAHACIQYKQGGENLPGTSQKKRFN